MEFLGQLIPDINSLCRQKEDESQVKKEDLNPEKKSPQEVIADPKQNLLHTKHMGINTALCWPAGIDQKASEFFDGHMTTAPCLIPRGSRYARDSV